MIRLRTILVLTALILTVLVSTTVQAQLVCAPRNVIVQALKRSYDEARAGMGLLDSRTILELWVSETRGTWTIIKSNPEGWTCIVASGVSWRSTIPDYSTPTTH